MDARAITKALGGKWAGRHGLVRCPCHADKTPSLKVRNDPRKDDGIDLHCFAGCDWKDIKHELRRVGLLTERTYSPQLLRTAMLRDVASKPPEDDTEKRVTTATKLWDQSAPLTGTPGWRYFTEHRGIDLSKLELDHALRWHAGAEAIIALMTTPEGNEPCGVHRTFLNPDSTKRERKMLGRQGVVRISADEDVTHGLGICEGIEDGLAILASSWAPVWAATSAGMVEHFPVLAGIEHLTIFADNDEVGMRAAQACSARWIAAEQEACIVRVAP